MAPSTIQSVSQAPEGRPIVAAQGLTKVFKDFWMRSRVRAVEDLDLEIRPREVFGLLGPNGSGKSTTIKMILGLLHKSAGRLAVFGKAPSSVEIKKRIGVLPEESYLYPFLNARETLDYYGKLFELDFRQRARRIDELLDMVGLQAVQHRPLREYSKGMQRRIGLAQALINDPEFLILDEPTSGLDPIGSRQVKDLIRDLGRRGKTILLSSHQLSDVEDCVDRMAILYGGKKRAEGTVEELLTARTRTVIETVSLDEETIQAIDHLVQERTGVALDRVGRPRQRLEELFVDIVDRARAERLETHGAGAGGPTAGFLLGDEQAEAEGESLIERLASDEQPEPDAFPIEDGRPRAETPPEEAPGGPDESVLAALSGEGADETAEPDRASEHAPEGEADEPAGEEDPETQRRRRREIHGGAPPDVDESLIGSLLDPADSEREPGKDHPES